MTDRWPGPTRTRETLQRLPIGDLVAWHLMVACPVCKDERIVLVRDLAAAFGETTTLAVLTPRLRCKLRSCRQPPSRIKLRNRFPQQPGPPLIEVMLKGIA